MHNAIEDLYILYIEETLSISIVYTILSSRPQSFPLSFLALCTILSAGSLHNPLLLIHCAVHKSCSLCLLPLPGERGIAGAISTPLAIRGFSRAESLPTRKAPSPVARSTGPAPVPWRDGGTLARRRDRPRSDGGMEPLALAWTVGANCSRRS